MMFATMAAALACAAANQTLTYTAADKPATLDEYGLGFYNIINKDNHL